jgi:hypothetical protein
MAMKANVRGGVKWALVEFSVANALGAWWTDCFLQWVGILCHLFGFVVAYTSLLTGCHFATGFTLKSVIPRSPAASSHVGTFGTDKLCDGEW